MECDEIEIDHLIALVEARPLLWDRSLEDHKSRNLTNSAWREVWYRLHGDFEGLNEREQNAFGKLVLKKWTNIKDSWVKAQKRKMNLKKSGARTCRRYLYEKQLAFLKKNLSLYTKEPTVPSSSVAEKTTEEAAEEEKTQPPPRSFVVGYPERIPPPEGPANPQSNKPPHPPPPPPTASTAKKRKTDDIEQKILDTLEMQNNRHLCFFKGIIPSLENLSEEQIVEFQVGVLNGLRNVRAGHRFSENPYVCSQPFQPETMTQYSSSVEDSSNNMAGECNNGNGRRRPPPGGMSPYSTSSGMSRDSSSSIDFSECL